MNAKGMPFGPHEDIDGAHAWARPGGLPGQRPYQGGDLNIWKFSKKIFYFRFLAPLPSPADRVPSYQKCPPESASWKYRLGARAPQKCHFCRLQLAYSRNCEHWFSGYLPRGFRVFGIIFCNIRNGSKKVKTPPKSTPKKSTFLCTHFWPT